MERLYSSVEIMSWLAHDEAVETAMDAVKAALKDAPASVCRDVLARCDVEKHEPLIAWLHMRLNDGAIGKRRVPRAYSPKHNARAWMLYYAADLECPPNPPRRMMAFS